MRGENEMYYFSEEKRKKLNAIKIVFVLFIGVVLALLLTACDSGFLSKTDKSESSGSVGKGKVKIQIKTPSAEESTIAPGRHFKVSGSLSGEIPDDARLTVTLLDAAGDELRFAGTDRKGTDRVIQSVVGGSITVFDENTDFSEVAYTAPELAVADKENPSDSSHDATVKCVYTDKTFYALIVSATDPKHGLAEADGYKLVDHDGNPYDALPGGKYKIRVKLSSADGKKLASASEEIEIGRKSGTVIHEITTAAAINKGGMDLLRAWAANNNLTILGDLLPGFFGPEYQMSTLPMSVSCETAEYLPGKIKMLVYGNTSISASYALEAAKYLQLEHNVENPKIAEYYAFTLGEPAFKGEPARIVKLGENENIRICRIDHVEDGTQDGVFITTEQQVPGSDTDPSDGWEAGKGAFAVAGVMKPYQLKDDELVPDDDRYGFYRYLNGAVTLAYTFTPADGSDSFTIHKDVGVRRIDEPGENSKPARCEFYNVFPADTLKSGNSYKVTVRAYDRKSKFIKGAVCKFTLSV